MRVPAGTVLIEEGSMESALTIIHSGLAELQESGRRVGLIKGQSLCGITDIREPGPARRVVRALSDCIITNIPVAAESLARRLGSDVDLNYRALQGLVQRVESAIYLFQNYKYLWHKLASIADSIALAYDFAPDILGAEPAERLGSSLAEYSADLRARTAGQGIPLPSFWDANVFVGRIQDQLDLYSDWDSVSPESTIDLPQFLFLKRLLGKDRAAVQAVLENDEPGTAYIYQRLGTALEEMIRTNSRLVEEIDGLLDLLFYDGGWIAQALDQQTDRREERHFSYYLAKLCYRFHKDAMSLLGRRLSDEYPIYRYLGTLRQQEAHALAAEPLPEDGETAQVAGDDHRGGRAADAATAPQDAETAGTTASAGGGPEAGATRNLDKYRGLTQRILEYSGLSQKDRMTFTELLERFKQLPNRLDEDKSARALRDELGTLYWRVYERCFLKAIDTDLKSFVPGIMLHFGLVDETLVSEDDLAALDNAYAKALYADETIPAMTLPYFLEKIYRGQVDPSLTEMGDTFAKRLKTQAKMTKRERAEATVYQDTPEDRVRFEIRNIAGTTSALLYGSRRQAFPILCRDAIGGDVSRLFLEPEEVARRVAEVRSRDFTLFHRDVGLRHKYGTDIVRKEIVPNFVLYPVAGSRMMMWQELDGTSRHTPGRIFMPFLFGERFDEAIITTLAQFRWELQKTIAGANWMDPVDGGLVGAYYDYINFFQKNPRMTPEAKERLRALVKKTRSDRERFTAEYINWVTYEYDGKVRLNPVAREIFYRHCPFPKNVREEMARKPLYAELEAKYQNRVRKSILKFESRTRRFERSGEPLPSELKAHIELLRA